MSVLDLLRFRAAKKLCRWHEHEAGGGSYYITIDDGLTLRFANHENTSASYDEPDYNFVDGEIDTDDVARILRRINYPPLAKLTAFSLHVGLTVPKLKKLLTEDCYKSVCENDDYPNTLTRFVRVAPALARLKKMGVTARIPVAQIRVTREDYCG